MPIATIVDLCWLLAYYPKCLALPTIYRFSAFLIHVSIYFDSVVIWLFWLYFERIAVSFLVVVKFDEKQTILFQLLLLKTHLYFIHCWVNYYVELIDDARPIFMQSDCNSHSPQISLLPLHVIACFHVVSLVNYCVNKMFTLYLC